LAYDPDLAHPAAGYRDAEAAAILPAGISERKLITRIDMRVIPVLSVLYLLAFLDRTNIANAAVFGLTADLGLKGNEYNTALTIFFVRLVGFMSDAPRPNLLTTSRSLISCVRFHPTSFSSA